MAVGSQGRIGKEPGNYRVLGQHIIVHDTKTQTRNAKICFLQNTKLNPKAYASFHSRFHSSIPH